MSESPHSYGIVRDVDVYHVRTSVRRFAESAGATRIEAAELEIVASELSWNILRHVGTGKLEVNVTRETGGLIVVVIKAWDAGPPLNFEEVLQDGWSQNGMILPEQRLSRKGIGCGLGAVQRFSSRFEQCIDANGKTLVVSRTLKMRWLEKPEGGIAT